MDEIGPVVSFSISAPEYERDVIRPYLEGPLWYVFAQEVANYLRGIRKYQDETPDIEVIEGEFYRILSELGLSID